MYSVALVIKMFWFLDGPAMRLGASKRGWGTSPVTLLNWRGRESMKNWQCNGIEYNGPGDTIIICIVAIQKEAADEIVARAQESQPTPHPSPVLLKCHNCGDSTSSFWEHYFVNKCLGFGRQTLTGFFKTIKCTIPFERRFRKLLQEKRGAAVPASPFLNPPLNAIIRT